MTIAEKIATQQAAKNAAPPAAAVVPGKPRGLVLSASQPEPTTTPSPAPAYQDERSLSLPDGQAVDMTPVGADPATITWHTALNSFASELAITNDPVDPAHSWIAIFPHSGAPPILLHRLQFREHPQTKRPENHPF
jgi:hypothetical protein